MSNAELFLKLHFKNIHKKPRYWIFLNHVHHLNEEATTLLRMTHSVWIAMFCFVRNSVTSPMPSLECSTSVDYSGNKSIQEKTEWYSVGSWKWFIKLWNSNFFSEFRLFLMPLKGVVPVILPWTTLAWRRESAMKKIMWSQLWGQLLLPPH